MKRLIKPALITLGFIISFIHPAESGTIIRSSPECEAVALILKSEDSGIKGLLCKNDQLKINSKVLITCRNQRKLAWLKPGVHEINTHCRTEKLGKQKCLLDQSCFRNSYDIVLIGNTFASQDPMPLLRWHPIERAKGYEVLIRSSSGEDSRRQLVDSPEYSVEHPLRHGKLYQFEIFAISTNISKRFAYYLPKREELEELNSALKIIQREEISDLDKARYQDSVYMSIGLLSDAIQVLEKSPEIHKSIELKQLLGDRYIQAGYFDKAKATYEKIVQLAPVGSQEHSEAMEILQIQNQLPTKTKLPQS